MEIDLYSISGRPEMYIADDDDQAIYTWSGRAVAYILDQHIYGWRGRHIGWFIDGIVYDVDGYRVGYTQEKYPRIAYTGRIKNIKYIKHINYVRWTAKSRPGLLSSESNVDLEEFLSQDKP